ncbi:glycosyltransferase family 4 protein [Helicobacter mehlei]|uniref:Glycosyltransferase family 4 protein n=3 Tax=Helicobacter mehlei TaxID=2316080 RepID=A0A553V3J3_9HELI|nr:glycosyltransferase family 1 protein [Helicobacter mehlei]TSA87063.1 glycosyltransferase family 4 protein [Helicobacter mehlei]
MLFRCNKAPCNQIFDLYIEPGFMALPLRARKILGTIHDLPLCDPKAWCLSDEDRARWTYYVYPRMSAYTEVITISQSTKSDILKAFGFPESRVHVIYHGVREYKGSYANLPPNLGEFILVVGAGSPRKNAKNLITAFKLLPQALQQRFKVVLAGPGINTDYLGIKPEDFLINLGHISDALLQTLYANARLLWFGSWAEGFGLPMVEAMQAKCVILTSHVSCMPEILGDAGFYCNPYDVQDIARQLEVALMDETLRKQCVEKGLERIKKFDLEESMEKHMAIIEKMLGD